MTKSINSKKISLNLKKNTNKHLNYASSPKKKQSLWYHPRNGKRNNAKNFQFDLSSFFSRRRTNKIRSKIIKPNAIGVKVLISLFTLSIDSADEIIELATYISSGPSKLSIIWNKFSLKAISSKSVGAVIWAMKHIIFNSGEIKLPIGATVGAVLRRNKAKIAHDDVKLRENDHVILFLTDKKLLKEVQGIFSPA